MAFLPPGALWSGRSMRFAVRITLNPAACKPSARRSTAAESGGWRDGGGHCRICREEVKFQLQFQIKIEIAIERITVNFDSDFDGKGLTIIVKGGKIDTL
jgi:hypothetical protein